MKCTLCFTGYYLNNTNNYPICTKCPIYCSSCTSATICTACTDTSNYIFVNTSGTISCATIALTNCQTALNLKCTVCLTGYYLNNASPDNAYPICTKCPIYCSSCTNATICTACTTSTGYIFVNT